MRHFVLVLVTLLGLFGVNTLSAQDESQEENVSKESTNVVTQMRYDTRWGLRTNMAYHTLNLTNLGIECNVNNHWGFVADALFPWWEAGDSHRTTKILSLGLEGRYYWRGCQNANHIMGGPYAGIYGMGGIYDWARNNKGFRGDKYFVLGGLSIGYSLCLSDSWRFDMALGVGALYTPYKHYHVKNDGEYLVEHYSGNYMYYGPTKAELSFVWFFTK